MGMALRIVLLYVFTLVATASTQYTNDIPLRINQFGDRTEDYLRVADDLAEALRITAARNTTRGSSGYRAAQARIDSILESIRLPVRMRFAEGDERSSRTCRLCNVLAASIIDRIRNDGVTGQELTDLATELCIRANIVSENVCRGLVGSNTPIVEWVIRNTAKLDGPFACSTIIAECKDGNSQVDWVLNADMGKKPKKKFQKLIGVLNPPPEPEPFRILQITDYHWDSMYNVGGNAQCGEPTCCRSDQGSATTEEGRAGRWGDYRQCDVPWETVEEFLQHAGEIHDNIDLVYFTGDIVDHGVWETSREHNKELILKTTKRMKEAFGDITVLPLLGNHEPHPLNVFAPDYIEKDELSSRWLYECLVEAWGLWLPPDTRETILRGGFYTVLVRPGFRVIALNNMFCYNLNWWLMHDPIDPAGQLKWLVDVLLAAEEAGEKVHILAHIPPGSHDCLEVWAREYAKIVDRFSETISAQFNGHTHVDEFSIFFGAEDDRPNSISLNGGSLTTYADVNPNYKIYLVDGNKEDATWNVLDAELWGFNLTAANLLPPGQRPHWYRMYSFRDKFEVESMHPVHMYMFVERMAKDPDLQELYYRYRKQESDTGLKRGCDKLCVETILCGAVTTVNSHRKHCEKLLKIRDDGQ